jgi:dTDP-4-dehydrorhamnose reductase
MAKYLLLGAKGQLGHDLAPRLHGEVIAVGREQIDLAEPESISTSLQQIEPDFVINCAAYNFVDRAESEPENAFAVNAFGVRDLAAACAKLGCSLVHFSSDHVFGLDTNRRRPWCEDDAPRPISVYGTSKLAGEYFVRSLCPKHFVIRTCGLYGVWGAGGKGGNFVETMLRMAEEGKAIRVVDDQTCTPTYTVDLAGAVVNLLTTKKFGLYHLTSSGACSWKEFATAIFELAEKDVTVAGISSAQFGATAKRPSYSVLGQDAYRRLGFPALRPWREALAAYLEERTLRK